MDIAPFIQGDCVDVKIFEAPAYSAVVLGAERDSFGWDVFVKPSGQDTTARWVGAEHLTKKGTP